MTKQLIILFIASLPHIVSAQTTYYVSNEGSSSNNGTSTSTTWDLAKVNSFTSFVAGDQILFKKGETFYGSITVNNSGSSGSPIIYGAYGEGVNPVITGFTTVSSWTNISGSIWESTDAVSTSPYLNMVTVNDVNTGRGRYPNTGYFYYQTITSTSLTSSDLSGTPNWTGAGLSIKKNGYSFDTAYITSQSGSTLNFNCPNLEDGHAGFGFIIQNDIRTLDTQNEWYYNPSTKKLSIYSTSPPTGVKVATIDNLMTATSKRDYITIDGIDFIGSNRTALNFNYNDLNNNNHFTIRNCNISYCGINAISVGGSNPDIENNTIRTTNNLGIDCSHSTIGATVLNNDLKYIGLIPGMTQIYGQGSINCEGSNTLVQYNVIDSSGYSGIRVLRSNTKVKNNFINHSCLIKDDGGGIYTWGIPDSVYTGREITGNIVLNTTGTAQGTSGYTGNSLDPVLAHGIYLDAYTKDVLVDSNTVSGCYSSGYLISNNDGITIRNNLAYDNSISTTFATGEILLQYFCCIPERNITMSNNVFVAKSSSRSAMFCYTTSDDISSFFTASDSNYFARPISDNSIINVQDATQRSLSISEWNSFTGQDAHSLGSPKAVTSTDSLKFIYNPNNYDSTIALDYKYLSIRGTAYDGTITLAPYSSAVLIQDGSKTTPVVAPPTVSTSGDQTLTTNSTTIFSTSSAADGETITGYTWTDITGSGTATITSPTSQNTGITDLSVGLHTFRITVTQSDGQTAYADVNVTLSAAPTANAGTDQTITLPTSSVILSGSGTVASGQTASYKWTKVSGSGTQTITDNTTLTPTVSGMTTAGDYVFQLKVTQTDTQFAVSTVTVHVNDTPAPTQTPKVYFRVPRIVIQLQ